MKALQKEKIFSISTATSYEEALELQDSGVDAITLQGVEAGGHRGLFDPQAQDPQTSLQDLLSQCHQKIRVPLIAAGEIMTSEDIRKNLSQGAAAIQMGTAFLTCQEAGTHTAYRNALLKSELRDTKTTRAFSGRLARGIKNNFMISMENNPESILPFPVQNKLTRDIRTAAALQNSSDKLSLWCGTGNGKLWTASAVNLIHSLFESTS